MSVEVRGNLDFALKRFKNQVVKSGVLSKAKERNEGYKKPGIQRREAIKNGIKNSRKKSRNY